MSERRIEELTDVEFDVLKEISNIGTGNAATAVSKIMDGRISIMVPVIKFLSFSEAGEAVGGAENEVVGILITLSGEIDGMMMLILDKHSARIVADHMLQKDTDEGIDSAELSEIEKSALNEFGNMIAGSYLSAVAKMTGLSCSTSVPSLADDMAGALLSVPAIEFGKISDRVLLIQSLFEYEKKKVEGYFILVPTLKAFEKIFEKLGL